MLKPDVINSKSQTDILTHFAYDISIEKVPLSALKATLKALLDNIGCTIGGANTSLAIASEKMVKELGGANQSTIIGRKYKTSMALAAYQNGIQANALDYDDAFENDGKGMGHPGSTIIPTAIAVGEKVCASGEEILSAILAGYEVTNRIIQAIQPTPKRHKQVWGVAVHQSFGSAIVASKLMKLSLEQLRNAFGLAATFSTLPAARKWNWRDRPLSSTKDMTALPAEAGVRAAILAENGWQGSRDILDGPSGFWIMAGSDRCNFENLTNQLGTRWTVEELSFKPYPACRWVHSALEATEIIIKQNKLKLSNIARVDVGTFEDVVTLFNDPRPKSMVDAEFSLQWPMAMVLLDIPKGPKWYSKSILRDPKAHAVADIIHSYKEKEAQRRHFSDERKTMSVVTIRTTDKHSFSHRVLVARGGTNHPWSLKEITNKFCQLVEPYLGRKKTHEVIDILLNFKDVKNLSQFCELLR